MRTLLVGAGVAVLYIVLNLATLTEFPLVWEDEPWYTQSAWSFAEHGTFALPMFADLGGFDRENVVYGRTYLAVVAAVYEVAGVSPFTARLGSLVGGLVAIGATYIIGRELWSRNVGLLAAALLALAPNVILQMHDARPEMMLVATWTTSLGLLLLAGRKGSVWLALGSGLLASLAADVHFNGLFVPGAIVLVAIVRRSPRRVLAAYLAGAAVGAAWWLWAHVLNDPGLFLEQVRLYSRGWPIIEVLDQPVVVFGLEVARYLLVDPGGAVVLVLFALIGTLAVAVKRPDRALLSLLLLAGSGFLFLALFVGPRTPIYAILLWPVAALIVARHVDIAPRPLAVATFGLIALVSVGSTGLRAFELRDADYDGYIARLRAVVPRGAALVAHPTYWFGFMDHRFIATQYFNWAHPYDSEMRRLGIDYVIADEFDVLTGCALCRDAFPEEARSFLASHGQLVAEIRDPHYGRVRAEDGDGYVTRVYRVTE